MGQDYNTPESFLDQVKEYLNTRLAQLKLSLAERVSKVVALVIAVVISALIFFLFLVLLSVAAAIALGKWLENYWLGFLITSGIILIAGFVLWRSKDLWLRQPIMNAFIKIMFEKEEDEKD